MWHGRRIAVFLLVCLASSTGLPAQTTEPSRPARPAELPVDGDPPSDNESSPSEKKQPSEQERVPPEESRLPEEEVELEELEPVRPPGRAGPNAPGLPPAAPYRPDGPLEPLTRSPELLPPARKFRSLTQIDLFPESRLGFQGLYTERRNRNRYSTTGTGSLLAEYRFLDHASIFMAVPYTQKNAPESAPREHGDNLSAGMKFAPGSSALRPAMGFTVYFATGDEELAIGSHNKGNLETYVGFLYAGSMIGFQGSIRYNAQSNLELNPPPGVEFERTWLADLALGIRLDAFEFVLEVTRKGRIAPEEASLWSTVFTPGINIGRDRGFVFSIGVPFTLSRGREYDYGVMLRGMWVF